MGGVRTVMNPGGPIGGLKDAESFDSEVSVKVTRPSRLSLLPLTFSADQHRLNDI